MFIILDRRSHFILMKLADTIGTKMIHAKQSPPPSPPLSFHNSSPLPSPIPSRTEKHSATAKRSKFLRRLIYFRHMDFEFALWQMLYLFISPQKV
ncbi:protein unc-50 homolog [Centruroides sculpturatus]|uniref:protein unc-50 homolog n=1 Tax=Centruroides sculpturatus TaxID=218467 RepID=UPI000C6C93DE|nr:protein unc-50 homolog [Centruroides sculpturatus]